MSALWTDIKLRHTRNYTYQLWYANLGSGEDGVNVERYFKESIGFPFSIIGSLLTHVKYVYIGRNLIW